MPLTIKLTAIHICFNLFATLFLSAQVNEQPVLVPAGSKVQDYILFGDRYLHPEFISGKVYFKNGATADAQLNYNFLPGEIEYIELRDTLAIKNPQEILLIAFGGDTFFYDKAYLKLIYTSKIRIAVKQHFELKGSLKRDSYGAAGSNSATDSFMSIETTAKTYKLVSNQDRVFQKMTTFYLAVSSYSFEPYNKKKITQLFPGKKSQLEQYYKTNKVNFNSADDLIKLADFLQQL